MEVKVLVRDIQEKITNNKPMAILTIETEKPLAIMQVRLFGNSFSDGTVDSLKSVVGTKQLLPLQAEVYNGQLQYAFPFGESFVAHKASVAPAASKA